jgi:hypothetical protein
VKTLKTINSNKCQIFKNKVYHVINNAYDAYWFLYNHPALNVMYRNAINKSHLSTQELQKDWISQDIDGTCYQYYPSELQHALDENLYIEYVKVDAQENGKINDDNSKNVFVKCWLEFGPLKYGYQYSGSDTPLNKWDTTTVLLNMHDIKLDVDGSTYDEALIKLAKLVAHYYGDYNKL